MRWNLRELVLGVGPLVLGACGHRGADASMGVTEPRRPMEPAVSASGARLAVDNSAETAIASSAVSRPAPDWCATPGPGGTLTCEGMVLRPAVPMFAVPNRLSLSEGAARVLDEVARMLHAHEEILLLRVEVSGGAEIASRRARFDRAQSRADALFRELWKGRGVWAERLDAVGYAAEGERGQPGWSVAFRVVQVAAVSPARASDTR